MTHSTIHKLLLLSKFKTCLSSFHRYSQRFCWSCLPWRPIDCDSEIPLFLDYGDEWEQAWQEHVAQYPRPMDSMQPRYASAHYMNTQFGDTAIRTISEQEYDPYPRTLQVRCHHGILPDHPDPNADYLWTAVDIGCSCRVEDRYLSEISGRDQFLYTVTVEWKDDDGEDDLVTWLVRTQVPRSAVRFFDLPYTTNLHQPTSFRHEIGIPDDMFPDQWRNMKEEDDSSDYDEEAEVEE